MKNILIALLMQIIVGGVLLALRVDDFVCGFISCWVYFAVLRVLEYNTQEEL